MPVFCHHLRTAAAERSRKLLSPKWKWLKLISDKSFPTFHIQIEYQIASRGVVRIMHHPPPYTDFAPLGRWDKLMSASDYYNLERERAQGNLR